MIHSPVAPTPADSTRIRHLLRWYPAGWRDRYGDEFAEMLVAEIDEQPRSWTRTANIAWSGIVARFTAAGLSRHSLEPERQSRVGLAAVGAALATFLVFGLAMWSQLMIGWQWSSPDAIGTTTGAVVLSASVLVFGLLALAALAPLAWHVVSLVARRQARTLTRPALICLAAATVLVTGSHHFQNGWPGTGGHHWALKGLVPQGVAAFSWASTLSVTSYWAHPAALTRFPTSEIVWMAVSPVAIVCLITGFAKMLRRLDLSPALIRFEIALARLATFVMAAFIAGCCFWIVDGGPGPKNLFHAGAIDIAGMAVLAAATAVAHRAEQRTRTGGLSLLRG